jgi:hypothetical protein
MDADVFPEGSWRCNMRWTAAQTLSWIIQQEPLEFRDWSTGIGPKIEPAQKTLATGIGAGKITAWGRRERHGSLEQIPGGDFRISGMPLTIGPHGDLATIPRHKISIYEGTDWKDIEFESDQIKSAWPKPPPSSAMVWMLQEAERVLKTTGHLAKREDLLTRCRMGTGCKKREAEAAHKMLPERLKGGRGRRSGK